MSDAPAPSAAPAAPTPPAAPQAAEGKPALSLVKDDKPEGNTLDVSAEGKARRGAKKREKQRAKAEREAAEAERTKAPAIEGQAAKTERAPEVEAEPAAEAKAERDHWSAKVKGELEAATKKIASFEKIAREGHAENAKLLEQIEDVTSDAEHYKGLFDRLVAGLKAQGFEIDPLEVSLAERDRELNRYKRRGERETKAGQDAQVNKMASDIKGRVEALVSKYPELNPRTNKEAADYLRFRLTADAQRFPLDTLERDLEAFARHLRAQMGAKAAPAQQSEQRPPRPQASTLSGASPAAVASKAIPSAFRTDKEIKTEFLRRRAARSVG